MKRTPQTGDYIKTVHPYFQKGPWRGKIRRASESGQTYLIEWRYCGGLPTDICTHVFDSDIEVVRRPKVRKT